MQTAAAGREGGKNGTSVEELEGKNDKGERISEGLNTGKRKHKKYINNLRLNVAIIRTEFSPTPKKKNNTFQTLDNPNVNKFSLNIIVFL